MLNEWRPIETAPKDGSIILSYWNDMPCFIAYVDWPVEYKTKTEIKKTGKWPFIKKEKIETKEIKRKAEKGFRVLGAGGAGSWGQLGVHGNYAPFTPKFWMDIPGRPEVEYDQ